MESRKINLDHIRDLEDFTKRYIPSRIGEDWKGRVDGYDASDLRWHQFVDVIDIVRTSQILGEPRDREFAIIGFACDEGVLRNAGRPGSSTGPKHIRHALSSLPIQNHTFKILDLGTITVADQNLEKGQEALADLVFIALELGYVPIILGGGHEVTLGHAQGVQLFLKNNTKTQPAKLKILNIDAHFDNRAPEKSRVSSGTSFYSLMEPEYVNRFGSIEYFALGIQKMGNTMRLFDRAIQTKTQYLLAEEFQSDLKKHQTKKQIFFDSLLQENIPIYLTVDMDAFSSAYAPGVSAPSILGLIPDTMFFKYWDKIMKSGKIISIDFAELNPLFDQDNRTAKLTAALIFSIIHGDFTFSNARNYLKI